MSVKDLIDKAAEKCGSRYKLAQHLGVTAAQVYDWETGRKPCSPADQARIAGFAGEDAVQQLVRATLEQARGETRKAQLEQLLGKFSRATGAVLLTVVALGASLTYSPTAMAAKYDECYVKCQS